MLVWKKIIWLRDRIKQQKEWIDRCGSNLTGYIANYGDPGNPPLNKDGTPKIIVIPQEKQSLVSTLARVPNTPDQFYFPHSGDGGTAIYNADYWRLRKWEIELNDLQITNFSAKQKADEMETKGFKVKE